MAKDAQIAIYANNKVHPKREVLWCKAMG